MRYFSFNELEHDGKNVIMTYSEQQIREIYFPYWWEKMCERFGEDYVKKTYSFEDCLDEWQVVNWAWEVDE